MNEKIISKAEFDEGIKLFVEICQCGLLAPIPHSNQPGVILANAAAAFAVELHKLKRKHCAD